MAVGLSLEDLYGDDNDRAFKVFALWANDFVEGFGIEGVAFDQNAGFKFVTNLQQTDFPLVEGFEKASPFKKAANMYVYLHNLSPFHGARIPEEAVGEHLAGFPHTATTLVGFSMVQECLHGATLYRNGEEEPTIIEAPINISKHFFADLVEASRGITPSSHFKTFSLLFEALAYEANPGLSYPKVFAP